jgi:hypothetical protein
MTASRIWIGLLLIGAAVAFLLFSIIPAVSENTFVMGVLQGMYCDPGDQLSAERIVTYDDDGTGYSADYTCTRPDESTYNVTGKSILYTIVGFTIPLMLGIGIMTTIRPRLAQNTQAMADYIEYQQMYPQTVASTPTQPSAGSPSDLAARLDQLKQAHESGLLTSEEYERKRAEILNEF